MAPPLTAISFFRRMRGWINSSAITRHSAIAICATVYRRLAEEWGLHVHWMGGGLWGIGTALAAFPDPAAALAYLKDHFRLVILSNVDNASFGFSNMRLGGF